jgi:hypothetical protein
MAASDPEQRYPAPAAPGPAEPPLPRAQAVPLHGQAAAAPVQSHPVVQGPSYPQGQPLPQGQPYPQAQPYQATLPQRGQQPLSQGQPFQSGPQPATPGRPVAARPILVQGGGSPSAVQPAEDEEEPEEELSTVAIKNAPPWLISALVHMVLMIVLAVILLPQLGRQQIQLESIWAEKLGQQLEFDSFLAGNDQENVDDPVLTPEDLPPVDNPFAAPADVDIVLDGVTATSKIEATNIGLALMGREPGMKRALLAAYGGNATTEAAVNRGLEWLARMQSKEGSWSLVSPYTNGATDDNPPAATAMALLAFQGAGHTHKEGNFVQNVSRGWNWLLKEQDGDGSFFHEGPFNHRFYTQGQCAIALCEIYGMTKDEKFRDPAERAIKYCLLGQSSEGGWRYSPGSDSDVSVTGWIVMALQSARMAGIEVPDDNLRRVERFLDKVATDGGTRYPYQRGRESTNVMTAEALLCRQYLGWPQNDDRLHDGIDWLTQPENLVSYGRDRNVYYWYYATQVTHHMGDPYWKKWNEVMRQAVPEQQVREGREAGSWDPIKPTRDEWEAHGGRLYVTCLSIYMLEVYYRHLPIYSNPYTFMQMR